MRFGRVVRVRVRGLPLSWKEWQRMVGDVSFRDVGCWRETLAAEHVLGVSEWIIVSSRWARLEVQVAWPRIAISSIVLGPLVFRRRTCKGAVLLVSGGV